MRRMRSIAFLAAAAAVVCMAAGCGKSSAGGGKETEAAAGSLEGSVGGETTAAAEVGMTCGEILEELLQRIKTTNCDAKTVYGDETYDEYFEYLYHMKLEKAEDGAFGYASAAYADEITVIRMADADDADRFLDKMDERIDRRKRDFEGYKPEEVAKLESGQRAVSGRYVVMAVCDDSVKVIDEFRKIMGE